MTEQRLALHSGRLRLELAPQVGGSISRFDRLGADGRPFPVLRGVDKADFWAEDAACFPLVPFSNRIRDGRFRFGGREIRLGCNKPGEASPLHGHGWLAAWTIEHHSPSRAEISFHHRADEWPWTYEARQGFALDPDGLDATISCRNLSDEPMPCGIGLHPYFHCAEQTRLSLTASHVWTIDEKVLPVERIPADGRYDLADRPICGTGLDNGFEGWRGEARIEDPSWPFSIRLSSATARHVQIYAPIGAGNFVVEPVSHANAALSEPEARWPDLGIRVLAPGETMSLDMRIATNIRQSPAIM